MNAKNEHEAFREMRLPELPADHKQRVLQRAAEAMQLREPRSIWDRIWESRLLSRAWAAVTLGLLVVHAGLGLVSRSPASGEEHGSAERRQTREIRKMLNSLPAVEISPRAASLALGYRAESKRNRSSDGSRPAARS